MDFEDLDIPVWVKKARAQPFAKGDIIFRSVNAGQGEEDDWETNASVRGANEYSYAEGYRRAGRVLADHVIQSRWDTDFLVYPIIFLYRHYVELQLKRLIPDAAFLSGHSLRDTDRKALSGSHSLNEVWKILEPILQELATGGFGITQEEIEATDSYTQQIHSVDEGSFSFRYLNTKSGAPSIDKDKLPHLNIGVFAEAMEKLTGYLFGLGEAFHDAVQTKCEMEDEARAEYAATWSITMASDRDGQQLAFSRVPEVAPAAIFAPTPMAAMRSLEFFTAQVNNDHTRKAYLNATRRFSRWCAEHGIRNLTDVHAFHIAAFIKDLQGKFSVPTVKQHLAGLRMHFDWLVTGQVLEVNPAQAVRGPKYVVKKGKTPVLNADEARALLDGIKVIRETVIDDGTKMEQPRLVGLRDRALIAVMVYSFARISAALQMKVCDYFIQGRRGWVRLHGKGGKAHEMPCHHNLEHYLDDYVAAAGIGSDADGPLFRTAAGRTGTLTRKRLWQQDAYRMIQQHARAAGIKTRIGNHTFRATGITDYLKNGGSLEKAQFMAAHESPRTTKLYGRRQDDVSLDEVERIAI